jgi:FeS assembly SUF system protein
MKENESREETPVTGEAGAGESGTNEAGQSIKQKVIEVLKTCYDPEIPVDIYELGLVYNVDVKSNGAVAIEMTLTSPACPVAESLPPEVERKVAAVEGVSSARVDVTWEPPWSPDMMSEAARLTLGM